MATKKEETENPQKIDEGYFLTGTKILVQPIKRNRRQYFEKNACRFMLGEGFKEIIASCKNGCTETEVLKGCSYKTPKSYSEVTHNLKIRPVSPDQMVERVIAFCGENESILGRDYTFLGICDGLHVIIGPNMDNPKEFSVFTHKPVSFQMVECEALAL